MDSLKEGNMEDAHVGFTTELMSELHRRQSRAIPSWYRDTAVRFLEEVIEGRHNSTEEQQASAEKLLVKYRRK